MSSNIEKNYGKQEKDSFVIDAKNTQTLQNLWDSGEFERIFNSPFYWTRITISEGSNYDKDIVLRAILKSVYPVEVFPYLYQIDGRDSFFLVRNSSYFIRRLALTSLQVPHPSGKFQFNLSITTNYLSTSLEPQNVLDQIKEALLKRYNRVAKTLDLTNFSEDPYLKDIYFCLNIPQCMHHILELTKRNIPANLSTLILQHNDLTSLEALVLIGNFLELDLRNNNLTWEGFERLQIRRGMKLNVVWLDGNPLCLNISESDYIKKVDAVIPYVRKVDGIDVSNVFFGHSLIKNYLCDSSWANFVDHFLHHYFGLMESSDRYQLTRMYHQQATFTFCAYSNPDSTENWGRLSNYMVNSRNLLTLSDVNKAYSTVKIGPEDIVDVLNRFPALQFDSKSFIVDVPFAQANKMILINVGGTFKELNSGLYYFHRSFLLTPFQKYSGEWKIENDMMSLTVATQDQVEKSFTDASRTVSPNIQMALNPTLKDKEALIPAVCDLTKLTKEWATRFLEEGSWDLELTLQAFIDQLKANQIPMRAFSV